MSEAISHPSSTAIRHEVHNPAEVHEVSGWVGWVAFASFMMALLGVFQMLGGLIGIFRSSWYIVSTNQLILFDNVHTWGWVHLILGAVIFAAGLSLLSGAAWARAIAVLLAGLSAISYMASIALYPVWSVIAITVAVLVIYAVTVHGGELREQYRE